MRRSAGSVFHSSTPGGSNGKSLCHGCPMSSPGNVLVDDESGTASYKGMRKPKSRHMGPAHWLPRMARVTFAGQVTVAVVPPSRHNCGLPLACLPVPHGQENWGICSRLSRQWDQPVQPASMLWRPIGAKCVRGARVYTWLWPANSPLPRRTCMEYSSGTRGRTSPHKVSKPAGKTSASLKKVANWSPESGYFLLVTTASEPSRPKTGLRRSVPVRR